MIIPRITTPAIFQTYGSIFSEAAGPSVNSLVGASCVSVVVEEAIRYLKFRYRSFLLQAPWTSV